MCSNAGETRSGGGCVGLGKRTGSYFWYVWMTPPRVLRLAMAAGSKEREWGVRFDVGAIIAAAGKDVRVFLPHSRSIQHHWTATLPGDGIGNADAS